MRLLERKRERKQTLPIGPMWIVDLLRRRGGGKKRFSLGAMRCDETHGSSTEQYSKFNSNQNGPLSHSVGKNTNIIFPIERRDSQGGKYRKIG